MDAVWDHLLDLLGETFLEELGDLGVTSGVGDLAGLLVAAGVVEGVGNLVLNVTWNLRVLLATFGWGTDKKG